MQKYDFSVFENAGITQTEFAKLLGVSRLTVHNWMAGNDPSPFLRRMVNNILRQISSAVDKGELPGSLDGMPPTSNNVEARLEYIRSVLDLPY